MRHSDRGQCVGPPQGARGGRGRPPHPELTPFCPGPPRCDMEVTWKNPRLFKQTEFQG